MSTNQNLATDAGHRANPWGPAATGSTIEASYRRGILRARALVSELTCRTARIDAIEALKPGATIWLTFPGLGPQPATVDWVQGFIAGVMFTAPFHPAVVDALNAGTLQRRH